MSGTREMLPTRQFPPPPFLPLADDWASYPKHVSFGIDLEFDRRVGLPVVESSAQFVCSDCLPGEARHFPESGRVPQKLGQAVPRVRS